MKSIAILFFFCCAGLFRANAAPVFYETDGLVAVEAEHFSKQTLTDVRQWYVFDAEHSPEILPDGDEDHSASASGNAYAEILPDTRRSHDDKLVHGENFSPEPGKMAVLTYNVFFQNPGKYYVWARIFSTNSEDNGIHVGLDGEWPASGQRMQWCEGKHEWTWNSAQRTNKNHCGERYKIFLHIDTPGLHTISFSMREDGTEFDKWLMTREREYVPEGDGPAELTELVLENKKVSNKVKILGELKKWHKVTLAFQGPNTNEMAADNPFMDYRLNVTFRNGAQTFTVPGFYAADLNAADNSAAIGNIWCTHFTPNATGEWHYTVSFRQGKDIALDENANAGKAVAFDGVKGSFTIENSDKTAPDFRARGSLEYVGKRYLQFAETGEFFLKGGADSPENFLGYVDFDQTFDSDALLREGEARGDKFLHAYLPHQKDWTPGDPTWKKGKGKGMIGALNYLAAQDMNSVYFLTMNITGDGKDVWPYAHLDQRFRFDCSKLAQWEIVFSHMQKLGLLMHVITQETENDQLLDGGELGPERKIYYRELIARFAHHPALVWNLGEENTNTPEQQRAFATFIKENDPYQHPIVIHTYPQQKDKIYSNLVRYPDIDGPSLQNGWQGETHDVTKKWIDASAKAGKQWFVCLDEIGPAHTGVKPDADDYWHDDVRHLSLWGNLMAGGAGVEWYFGYRYDHNDLYCEDWRSRENMWKLTKIALDFFNTYLPFDEMQHADELTTNPNDYCFAKENEIYAIYLPWGETTTISLPRGKYSVHWYNPMTGGELVDGSITSVKGGTNVELGQAPGSAVQDWVVLIKKQ